MWENQQWNAYSCDQPSSQRGPPRAFLWCRKGLYAVKNGCGCWYMRSNHWLGCHWRSLARKNQGALR